MISKQNSYYNFFFYNKFVIAEAHEGVVVDSKVVEESLKLIFDHFKSNNFTLISHRKNNYTVNLDIYDLKRMRKLRAIAVVSPDSTVKEKAMAEQMVFDQSFAFFDNLEDAIGWAESVISR